MLPASLCLSYACSALTRHPADQAHSCTAPGIQLVRGPVTVLLVGNEAELLYGPKFEEHRWLSSCVKGPLVSYRFWIYGELEIRNTGMYGPTMRFKKRRKHTDGGRNIWSEPRWLYQFISSSLLRKKKGQLFLLSAGAMDGEPMLTESFPLEIVSIGPSLLPQPDPGFAAAFAGAKKNRYGKGSFFLSFFFLRLLGALQSRLFAFFVVESVFI